MPEQKQEANYMITFCTIHKNGKAFSKRRIVTGKSVSHAIIEFWRTLDANDAYANTISLQIIDCRCILRD